MKALLVLLLCRKMTDIAWTGATLSLVLQSQRGWLDTLKQTWLSWECILIDKHMLNVVGWRLWKPLFLGCGVSLHQHSHRDLLDGDGRRRCVWVVLDKLCDCCGYLSCLMAIAGEGAPCTLWLLRRMAMVQVLSGDSGSFEGSAKGSSGARWASKQPSRTSDNPGASALVYRDKGRRPVWSLLCGLKIGGGWEDQHGYGHGKMWAAGLQKT